MISLRRALSVLPLLAAPLWAQDTIPKGVRLGIVTGGQRAPGLVVLPVPGANGDSVRAMLQRDLGNGDRVTIIGKNADDLPPVSGVPNYAAFAQMGVASIVQASVTPDGELHVALHQVAEKRPTQAKNFTLGGTPLSPDWRMAIHRSADSLELWATGVPGISATRIAYVRANQIWQIDSDGANAVAIEGTVDGRAPTWHPSSRYLAFSTLAAQTGSDAGGISMRDLWSGTTKRLTPSVHNGNYATPAFSPDGTMLAYSFGDDGTEIWMLDPFKGGAPKKITTGRSTISNTMPTFSADGRQFAFTSGRLGHPEVYIADVDGSNVRLLTDEGFSGEFGRSNPAWSPDGRTIAYQSQNDGKFQIMTILPSGKQVSALTGESENEDPSWAPDGRHLVFTSVRTGGQQLWVLDTESATLRQLTFGGGSARYSAWSPPIARR